MNMNDRLIINTMRIVGAVVMASSVALMAFLAWIAGSMGIDGFLIMSFGVGIFTLIGGGAMVVMTLRDDVEEDAFEREYVCIDGRCVLRKTA